MTPEEVALYRRANVSTRHQLRSSNKSTAALLSFSSAILDSGASVAPHGEIRENGVDPSGLEARVFAWCDGMSKRVSDRSMCLIVLGAAQRLVHSLEESIELTDA